MAKPTERIVVFVTPAQKLAITSSAQRLDISVSELMRRAVSSFGATEAQVKVAELVDRLKKPSTPDPLTAMLAASRRMIERKDARTPKRATGGHSAARLANDDAVGIEAHAVQMESHAASASSPATQAESEILHSLSADGLPHPINAQDDAPAVYKPPHAPSGDDTPPFLPPMLNPSV